MITAIGTANSAQITHKINHHIIILMKITTGFTPRVLFINKGIMTLFSNCWIINTTPIIINTP